MLNIFLGLVLLLLAMVLASWVTKEWLDYRSEQKARELEQRGLTFRGQLRKIELELRAIEVESHGRQRSRAEFDRYAELIAVRNTLSEWNKSRQQAGLVA